jgi:phosphomannomutase
VVRNIATTHQLDAIAHSFDYKCHEVPVGFKHVSGMMEKTNALIGGESSGGLTIKGHVKGKDGIFAAGLLVEMMSVTGKGLGEMIRAIDETYGSFEMAEANFVFSEEVRQELMSRLFTHKEIPDFSKAIDHVSYLDGVKVYFKNGDWIIARFSGTEPLIRIFSESDTQENAKRYIQVMKTFLGL